MAVTAAPTTLRRVAYWPPWVAVAGLAAASVAGLRVPLPVQYAVLAATAVVLGLPHGAADYLVPSRLRATDPSVRGVLAVGLLYLVLGGGYALVWFAAPALAAVAFVLLTWFHWGQGDLYPLVALGGADHLSSPASRALAVGVRGALPMVVPLVAFPDRYRAVVADLVGLFAPAATARLDWAFRTNVRAALAGTLVTGVLVAAALGFRSSRPGHRRPWLVDVGEMALLGGYFLVVPPVLAIAWYFTWWHSLRHVVRLAALDDRSTARDGDGWPALRRFYRDATPLTVAALVLLVGFATVVPYRPTGLADGVAVYLVLLAVLALPHAVLVTWMDRSQGLL
ncbi:Brp/Blh family beta-carotene 15,15'-dioxygenase [Halobacteriaceae archaeon GCM10025711]